MWTPFLRRGKIVPPYRGVKSAVVRALVVVFWAQVLVAAGGRFSAEIWQIFGEGGFGMHPPRRGEPPDG
jgi:hypothetical protein